MLSPSQYIRQGKNDRRGAPEKESRPVNVQVAVRCRPLNEREKTSGDRLIVKCDSARREIVFAPPAGRKVPSGLKDGKKTYTYDHVFGPDSSQDDVYKGVVKPIVDEVLEGYNCTVFAYGQTGTGKTHTMEGQRDDGTVDMADKRLPENAGMIPRAVKQIFDYLRSLTDEHSVKVSHLELYNEQLTDLLGPENDGKDLRMYEDNTKGVFVNGLDEFVVKSEDEIFKFLDKAALQRKTAETLMNKFSSRSHSVFSITIHIKESSADGSELLKVGKLNLVDLAGSENVGRSGAINKRAREAGNINQSLLTLGRVITALVEKHPHIPYRDSKLTRLLQESLGGRNKTCIIATATCASSSYEETASTFDYAYRAKSIKNRPTVNQMIAKNVLMKDFTDEISKLKRELDHARSKKGVYLPVDQYEELTEELASLKEQNTADEEKCRLLETKTAEMKENLEKSQEENLELKGELSEERKGHKLTQENLSDKEKELEEEKIVSTHFKNLSEDYLLKGKQLQTTLSKAIGHNNSLHARVDEHRRIEKENQQRISNLQNNLAESQVHYSTLLKEYETKHDDHIKNIQAKISQFVSSSNEQVNETAKSYSDFRKQIEELGKKHDGEHSNFEKSLVISATTFEISCRNSVESQKVRLSSIVDHVNTETAAINEHFKELHKDISLLGDSFKSFDSKQNSAFEEFVTEQKSKFSNASENVSNLLMGQEKSLTGIKSKITETRATQMEELEKMKTNVLNQVSQILADCINKQSLISKDTVDNAVNVIDQTVTEGNETNEKTTKICAELGTATDEFSKYMGDERTNFSNTITTTVEEAMERTEQGTEIVHVHSKGTISLLSEVRSEAEKMQMTISAHRNTMGDTIKSRNTVRLEENKEVITCLEGGENVIKTNVEDIEKQFAAHESNLGLALEENVSMVRDAQIASATVVENSMVKPVSEFSIETDGKISDAPEKEKYVYPNLLEEGEERNVLLDPTGDQGSEELPVATKVQFTENKKDVPSSASSSDLSDSLSSPHKSDEENNAPATDQEDDTMDSVSSAEEASSKKKKAKIAPDVLTENEDANKSSKNKDNVLIPGVSNKNVTISRKRKAMSKSKSKKIRRPRVLAKKSAN